MANERSAADAPERKTGKVDRVGNDFGFILSEELPDQAIYFKTSWFRSDPPLRRGDSVTFELKSFGDRLQAHNLTRLGQEADAAVLATSPAARGTPATERLLEWAYMGYVPRSLADLARLALHERWEFKNAPRDPDRPQPILYSYILQTFGRLVLEEKVLVNRDASFAAFNTGLVDPRYEAIYALFIPSTQGRSPWRFSSFCLAGEGADGQNLVRHFNPLPPLAHYFDHPADLLYDTRVGKPEMDWRHVVIDRIDRYPKEFIEDHWPTGFEVRDTAAMSEQERKIYWGSLGAAIEQQSRTYRGIMNRVKDAVDLSIKRVGWNFKTAVPQYYPRVRHLQLLLPINLVSDDQADMALAVEKTPSGSYLGHTVLALDWAYQNARLICRPDSDWLAAQDISEGPDIDAD